MLRREIGARISRALTRLTPWERIVFKLKHYQGLRLRTLRILNCSEFKTLEFMTRHAHQVISRDELLNEVWGYHNYPRTRTVDNHILKLRQKLESNPAEPRHFLTIQGVGYKFVP